MCGPCTPLPLYGFLLGGLCFACFLVLGVLGVSFGGVLVLVWCCSAAVLLGYLGRRRLVFGFGWGGGFRRLYVCLFVYGAGARPRGFDPCFDGNYSRIRCSLIGEQGVSSCFSPCFNGPCSRTSPGLTTRHFSYRWLLTISVFSRSRWLFPSS